MFRRFARVAIILAICVSIGAHWAALQSVAWATMLVEYSQHATLKKAIVQTFDGDHPCDLCKRVVAEQQLPKKSAASKFQIKPDLICAAFPFVLRPASRDIEFPTAILIASGDDSSPPTPPPRFNRAG
jgi:hypothetical protein